MLVKLDSASPSNKGVVEAKCPHCGHLGSFESIGISDASGVMYTTSGADGYWLGVRRCPRNACHGQILFQILGDVMETFPSQKIDFNTDSIPQAIVDCFDEALVCESAKCFTASAIMVRKTLEMVCEERGAQGKRLVDRIQNLKSQVTLPQALFDAMNNLRLLGNDAAHLELKDFDQVGRDELEIAIDLTKEILKALYQLDSIASRLEALKRKKQTTDVQT